MKQRAYAAAGVDIDLGNRVKATLPQLLASTRRREVLGKVGGFGGLFALDTKKFAQPVLVSSTDGVGTKLKIAFAMDRHDTVGQDLVNHCALIGGETAQMPGFYRPGEYDVSGTIVGVVEKARILDGKSIRPGDAVIGLASSGLHTNGYSLARKIFFGRLRLKPGSYVRELNNTVGEELLKVHVSYGPLARKLLKKFNPPGKGGGVVVKGLAHITGGGFIDNIPRVLPRKCDVVVRRGSWVVPPLFQFLQARGGVEEAEMYQVFNMGVGMTVIVAGDKADAVLRFIRAQKQAAWLIGEVVSGAGTARIV